MPQVDHVFFFLNVALEYVYKRDEMMMFSA